MNKIFHKTSLKNTLRLVIINDGSSYFKKEYPLKGWILLHNNKLKKRKK